MPVTPFHFGPGAAIHAFAPKRLSFIAFCVANILIDIEPLYFMATGQRPLHRFLHTYIGATLIALATVALFLAGRTLAQKQPVLNAYNWRSLPVSAVVAGAFAGTYTHIALDSIMHTDIQPFAPFYNGNPLLHLVSLSVLHWGCVIAGAIGMIAIMIKRRSACVIS